MRGLILFLEREVALGALQAALTPLVPLMEGLVSAP